MTPSTILNTFIVGSKMFATVWHSSQKEWLDIICSALLATALLFSRYSYHFWKKMWSSSPPSFVECSKGLYSWWKILSTWSVSHYIPSMFFSHQCQYILLIVDECVLYDLFHDPSLPHVLKHEIDAMCWAWAQTIFYL